jgi:hypothetical protein
MILKKLLSQSNLTCARRSVSSKSRLTGAQEVTNSVIAMCVGVAVVLLGITLINILKKKRT